MIEVFGAWAPCDIGYERPPKAGVFYWLLPARKGVVEMGRFVYFCPTTKERWESGLIHKFAKLAYSYRVPGVRIPPSPQSDEIPPAKAGFLFARIR